MDRARPLHWRWDGSIMNALAKILIVDDAPDFCESLAWLWRDGRWWHGNSNKFRDMSVSSASKVANQTGIKSTER